MFLLKKIFFSIAFFVVLAGSSFLTQGRAQSYIELPPKEPRITAEYLSALERDATEAYLGIETPKAFLFNRNGFIDTDANDKASQENKKALELIAQYKYHEALEIYKVIIEKSAHFFPARFNAGRLYLLTQNHSKAVIAFTKARLMMPQYNMNYYFLGRAHELAGDFNAAVENFRMAFRYNPYDLRPLIAWANALIDKKRYSEAQRIYGLCLERDRGYNDALVGLGKVLFYQREYFDATQIFAGIDRARDFSKELHYYYAEAAFLSQQYQTAVEEYQEVLKFPQDEVYTKISLSRMRFRLKQAERFLIQKDDK